MSTDILYNRAIPFCENLSSFNGSGGTTDYSNWRQMYVEMRISAWDSSYYENIESISSRARPHLYHDTIPIALAYFNYDQIKPDAFTNHLLTYDSIAGLCHDSFPRSTNPYESKIMFAGTSLLDNFYQGTYRFYLSNDFIFGNSSLDDYSVSIDFGDGTGPRTITRGNSYSVTYEDTGKVTITYVLTSGGNTITTSSEHKVKYKTTSTDPYAYIEANIPFPEVDGMTTGGIFNIHYGKTSGVTHTCIKKPLIILDGIDFGSQDLGIKGCKDNRCGELGWPDLLNPPSDYPALKEMPTLISNLSNAGYDIIFLDNFYGGDLIERNAMLLVRLLNNINGYESAFPALHKCTCEESVIIGPSMGGLVAQYALAYMEKHNMDHQASLYLSFDSPHQGANIPLGVQKMIYYFGNAGSDKAADARDKKLSSPAAREMLIYHTEYSADAHPMAHLWRGDFISRLNELGTYPVNLRKIAISNGSSVSTFNQGFSAGAQLVQYDYTGLFANAHAKVWALPGTTYQGDDNVIGHFHYPSRPKEIYTVLNSTPAYDNTVGCSDNQWRTLGGWVVTMYARMGIIQLLHDHYCFIPSISSLDVNTTNLLYDIKHNVFQDQPNSLYPFEAYKAPEGGNEYHIQITTGTNSNTDWALDQIQLVQLEDHISLDNTSGKEHYNFGSYKRILPDADVSNGATLQINGNYATRYGQYSEPFSYFKEFRIHTPACSTTINIYTGSYFILGDNSLSDPNRGIVEIKSGSVVHLYSGSHLKIYNGSKLIIEKGAKLICENGVIIDLLGSNAILEIRGKLQLSTTSSATFTLSSSSTGFVRFHQEYPPEHNILATGTSSQFILTGTGNKVLEVTGDEGVDPEDGLALFKINSGRVLMDANCRLNIGCPLDLNDVTIDALQSGTANYHRGLHIYGQSSVRINTTEIDHGSYGIFALQNYGGYGVTLSGVKISDCITGVHSEGQWINFMSRCSLTNCTNAAWEAYQMDNASSTFSDSYINGPSSSSNAFGIFYQAASSSAPLIIDQSRIQNNFIGVDIFSTDAQVSCSKIEDNTYGIVQWDGSLNMSPNQTPAGGSTSLMGNNTSLFVSGGASFDISDGDNNFDAGSGGYTIDGTLGYCFSPMVYLADWNYWPGGGYPTGVNAYQFCSGVVTPLAVTAMYAYSMPIINLCYTGPTPISKRDVVQLSDTIVYPVKDSIDYQIDSARINIVAGRCLKASRTLYNVLNNYILNSGNDAAFLKTYKGMMFGIHKAIENKEINPDTTVVPGIIDSVRSLQDAAAKQFKSNSGLEYLRYLLLSDRAGLFAITNQRDSSISILENMRSWVTDQQLKQVNLSECHIIAEDSVKKGISKKEDFERLIKPCHPSKDTLLSTPQQPTFNSITKESRKSKIGLILYPNPSSGDVNALITLPSAGNTTIRIYNMEGKLVETLPNLKLIQGENSVKLPMAGQVQGLYMISVEGNNFSFKEKLIKH